VAPLAQSNTQKLKGQVGQVDNMLKTATEIEMTSEQLLLELRNQSQTIGTMLGDVSAWALA